MSNLRLFIKPIRIEFIEIFELENFLKKNVLIGQKITIRLVGWGRLRKVAISEMLRRLGLA
ncbi:hypothetical protein D5E70_14215 [Vibrio parahaemolyticus]|nr:hypothetical protein D5E70_14215 [Vibrio parahaemolyticus]